MVIPMSNQVSLVENYSIKGDCDTIPKQLSDILFVGGVNVKNMSFGNVRGSTYLKRYVRDPALDVFNPESVNELVTRYGIRLKITDAEKDGKERLVLDNENYTLDWKISSRPEGMLWGEDLIEVKYSSIRRCSRFEESQQGIHLDFEKKLESLANLRLALLANDFRIKGEDLEQLILPSYDRIIDKIREALVY